MHRKPCSTCLWRWNISCLSFVVVRTPRQTGRSPPRACNLYKATHVSGSDPESHTIVRLFYPREDRWEDHFQVAPESGEMVGRTPIGRATVMRLGLNSAAQVAARRQWIRLGLFP